MRELGLKHVVAPPETPKRPGLRVTEAETLRAALKAALDANAESGESPAA